MDRIFFTSPQHFFFSKMGEPATAGFEDAGFSYISDLNSVDLIPLPVVTWSEIFFLIQL